MPIGIPPSGFAWLGSEGTAIRLGDSKTEVGNFGCDILIFGLEEEYVLRLDVAVENIWAGSAR
jgi:hypothetical protein